MTAASAHRRVVPALGIAQILAWGSTYYLLAVLAQPIAAETGWPHALVIAGISLGLLVEGLAAMLVGRVIHRFGGRRVLAASAGLIAAGLLLLAAAPSLPVYFAGWIVLGLGMAAGLYDAAFSTLGRLFGAEGRRAITHLTLWGGFASTVCWPLSAILVETVGWRGACVAYAVLHLAVTLPLYLLAVPREEERPRAADAAPARCRPRLLPQGNAVFLLLAAILTTGSAIAGMISVHLIALLQAGGLTLAAAVGLGALIGPAQVAGRVLEMLSGQRHHPFWSLAAAVSLVAAGLGMLAADLALPGLALIAYGAGNGIWSIARGALPLALAGPEAYPVLMGRLATPSLIAQAAAPSIGAALMVASGPGATLGAVAGLAALNVVAVGCLGGLLHRRKAMGAAGS